MKNSELIEELEMRDKDLDVEILLQTTINGEYYNINTKNILSVEDDDSSIIIRCHER